MRNLRFYLVVVFMVCMTWQAGFAEEKGSSRDWFQKGQALNNEGAYDEAIRMYTSAIAGDRKYGDAYVQRGHAYRVSQPTNPWPAMADFNRAIAINRTNAEAYYQRGLLNAFLINNEDARKDMLTAAGLGHEGARMWLARVSQETEPEPLVEMAQEAKSEEAAPVTEEKRADLRDYLPSKREPVIYFDFDKSTIKADFHPILDEVAGVMKNTLPTAMIVVGGHTDGVGTETYNEALSLARAEAVKSYLNSQAGIGPDRIVTKGYGQNSPVDTNETEEGRAKNRRAYIQIYEEQLSRP